MEPALAKLAELAVKLGNGVTLGPAESEGYFPRGARKEGRRYASAATRAGDMLMARLTGSPWTTELLLETPDASTPAAPVSDLSNAKIAMMTSGGLVPRGNPDGQVRGGSTRWWKYSIDGLSGLSAEEWESIHRGVLCRDNERRAQLRNAARRDETARRRRRHCRNSPRQPLACRASAHTSATQYASATKWRSICKPSGWTERCSSPPEALAIVAAQR